MEIFANYIIVDEKAMNDITFIKPAGVVDIRNANSTKFFDLTAFASLKFEVFAQNYLLIKDIDVVSPKPKPVETPSPFGHARFARPPPPPPAPPPLAQIIVWEWAEGRQRTKEIILKKGGTTEAITCPTSIVIRILKKRKVIENPCLPLSSPDDDLAVFIGKDRLVVSAHQLMSVSPMINRMLSVDMKEKQERTINLDGLGVSMEQFKDFLNTITIQSFHHPFFPNPKNVLELLKLSDYFQVDWLKERCGVHLVNCVEMPHLERFLLIERYRLDNLKECFSQMLIGLTSGK